MNLSKTAKLIKALQDAGYASADFKWKPGPGGPEAEEECQILLSAEDAEKLFLKSAGIE